ncbi:MAG: hypothetical protein II623_06210, partial [Paludibacteraceae bacterium]|nr:hypothetical protein [Paludibacteraceae bacterium]
PFPVPGYKDTVFQTAFAIINIYHQTRQYGTFWPLDKKETMNLSSEKSRINNGLPNEKRAVRRTALYIAGATAPCRWN